jgi:hypothetical protein
MDQYMNQWDGVVMCYLPGSEGDGVANVLVGKSGIKGTLPMPYYSKVEDIRTDKVQFPLGYGLNINKNEISTWKFIHVITAS